MSVITYREFTSPHVYAYGDCCVYLGVQYQCSVIAGTDGKTGFHATDWTALSSGGGFSTLTGNVEFDFGATENEFVTVTVSSLLLTNANIKTATFIWQTSADHVDIDESLVEGLSVQVGTITDNVSFQLVANAINSSTGIYTYKYIITYS